jgi:glycosyltransferase involved in cell wall biosynthesis
VQVLVATITHRADDARIFARQIPALLDAGHSVTAVAPWRETGVKADARIHSVETERARGRRRILPLGRAVATIRGLRHKADVIIVHDPELALALSFTRLHRKTIWDVHEDLPAALLTKSYLPAPIRRLAARAAKWSERWMERRLTLMLAESAYSHRFQGEHECVLNLPSVPPLRTATVEPRVIYVGSVTKARGLDEMIAIARYLRADGISVMVIGEAPAESDQKALEGAENLTWLGPLPNDQALAEVERSLAGLSLLHDLENYRHSMPTKVLEYMARGIPVITTPLPLAVDVLGAHGFVVPFDSSHCVKESVDAIRTLAADPSRREELRSAAHKAVDEKYNWDREKIRFVEFLLATSGTNTSY